MTIRILSNQSAILINARSGNPHETSILCFLLLNSYYWYVVPANKRGAGQPIRFNECRPPSGVGSIALRASFNAPTELPRDGYAIKYRTLFASRHPCLSKRRQLRHFVSTWLRHQIHITSSPKWVMVLHPVIDIKDGCLANEVRQAVGVFLWSTYRRNV